MSDVPVYDMDFRGDSATDNRVIAASYGRGVYSGSFASDTNPPVTVTDSITLAEAGTATTTSAGSSNVLSNDTDPDGDALQAQLVSSPLNTSSLHFKVQVRLHMFIMVQKQQQILLLTEPLMELNKETQ